MKGQCIRLALAALMGTAAPLMSSASPAGAQSRLDLIRQSRAQFADSAALDILMAAADPSRQPPDSLWAVSVYEIGDRLMGLRETALASTWLRWAARHGAQWPIDQSFPPALVTAFEQAATQPRSVSEPAELVTTRWRWPAAMVRNARGTIEVTSSDPSVQLLGDVIGQGTVSSGAPITLAPGTYEVTVSAEGYEQARVMREVLPGVVTVLDVSLAPLWSPQAGAAAASSLVLIRSPQAPSSCSNGLIVRPDGFVLAPSGSLPQTQGLQVEASGRVFTGVSVVASDPARGFSVLKLDGASMPVLPTGTGSDRQYAWAVYHNGCGATASARTRLQSSAVQAMLAPRLPIAARGAPLIDRGGSLLGLVMGPGELAPISLADEVVRQAAEALAIEIEPIRSEQVGGRGGFPLKWVGLGAATAGLGAFLLTQLGGGESSTPTTGTIVISLPPG